jgi:hypothetical protein
VKDGGDRCHPASTQDVAPEHKENIWQFVKRRAVNTLAAARQFAAALRAAGKIGLDRLSGPPATAARPAFHRQRCSIRAQARSCGCDFLTVSTQDRIGLQQPRGVHRKLCSRRVVPAVRTVDPLRTSWFAP